MLKPQPSSVKLIRADTECKCVHYEANKDPTRRYVTTVSRANVKTVIGRFESKVEAAYCYATSPEGLEYKLAKAVALREEQDMTSAQAIATAAEERLELQTGGSGFVGVFQTPQACKLPFMARVWRGRKDMNLGYFWSAEAAALCYARSPEGRAAAEAKRAEAQALPPMTAAAALEAAAEEGLELLMSDSGTRFLGVYRASCSRLPFRARLRRDGLEILLGRFATAEEAALCRARELAAQAEDASAAAADEPVATSAPKVDGGRDDLLWCVVCSTM